MASGGTPSSGSSNVTENLGEIDTVLTMGQIPAYKREEHAESVRKNMVNWKSYLQGQMISQEVYSFISQFDRASAESRARMLSENPFQFVMVFHMLIEGISQDQTLQYVLTMLDDVLQEDRSRVEILKNYAKKKKESVWQPFFRLLTRDDKFIVYQASRIISFMAYWSKEQMERRSLYSYMVWLNDQMKIPSNEYLLSAVQCLQLMLRNDTYCHVFMEIDGVSTIVSLLAATPRSYYRAQFQLVFCLFCISISPNLAAFINRDNIIPTLADVLRGAGDEILTDLVVSILVNLIDNVKEENVKQEYAQAMVQCKLPGNT